MTKADQRYSISCVRVLCDYARMEVDSNTFLTTTAKQLVRDIEQIPARYAALLASDDRERKQRKGGKPMTEPNETETPAAETVSDDATGATTEPTPADDSEQKPDTTIE